MRTILWINTGKNSVILLLKILISLGNVYIIIILSQSFISFQFIPKV